MKGKMVSAIMLTLLLMSMLMSAFNIQPAKASGTIYIRADGSIDPPTALISTADNVTYTFTGDIIDSIVVERDNIVVDGAGYTVTGSGGGDGITLVGRTNVAVRNMTIKNFDFGIGLTYSSNNTLSGNNVTANSGYAIYLYYSSNNTFSGNNVANNVFGIWLHYSSNNTFSGNNVANNGGGIILYDSANNTFSGNNVTANNRSGSSFGIALGFSSNNILSGNNVANNGGGIRLTCSPNNVLSGNNVANNGNGIMLSESANNTLSSNNVTANSLFGIEVYFYSDSNVLSCNNVANNVFGIRLYGSSNNTLSGNVMGGNRYNFGVESFALSDFLQSVDTSNLVDGKPVYYFVNQSDIVVNSDAYPQVGYLGFVNCANVAVEGLNLTSNHQGLLLVSTNNSRITSNNVVNNWEGICLFYSSNSTLSGNNVTANGEYGICLYSSSNNIVSGNNVTANNRVGIWLEYSSDNTLSGNNVANNGGGIGLYSSSNNNVFYHNNFISNTQHVWIETPSYANSWDDDYPYGGNYWSDYTGVDVKSGPYQNETGSDGIGDTPHVIGEDNQDNYPLMKPYPWASHDVGIASVTASKNVVGQGFNVSISACVFNYGDSTENINVTIYANSATICEINNVELASRNSTTIAFTWNTAGFAIGNYNVIACATPVSGETDTADNNSTDCWVLVTILGDVDGDFEDGHYDIDLFDAVKLLACYGAKEGDSNFDPNCDIDDSGQVFLFDAVILLSHYGQKYP